jgi:hypothetical protein
LLDESVGNRLVHQVRVEGLELFSQIGGDTRWQGRLGSRLAINALPVLKTIRFVWECLGLEAVGDHALSVTHKRQPPAGPHRGPCAFKAPKEPCH